MNKFCSRFTSILFLGLTLHSCTYLRAKIAAFRLPPPTLQISSISPTVSSTAAGSDLTIYGTLFKNGIRVVIGKNNCDAVHVISDTELNCRIPKNSASTVGISVTHPNGETVTMADAFVYADKLAAPVMSKVNPTEGSINGSTILTITGAYFRKGDQIKIGLKSCLSIKVISAGTIVCETPPASSGKANITLQDSDGITTTLNSVYTYTSPETYSALKADIFTNKCSSCHGNSGGFSTQIYSQIFSKVLPGNPNGSLLYQQVASGLMPRGGPLLLPSEKQKIFDWILDGAKDN